MAGVKLLKLMEIMYKSEVYPMSMFKESCNKLPAIKKLFQNFLDTCVYSCLDYARILSSTDGPLCSSVVFLRLTLQ